MVRGFAGWGWVGIGTHPEARHDPHEAGDRGAEQRDELRGHPALVLAPGVPERRRRHPQEPLCARRRAASAAQRTTSSTSGMRRVNKRIHSSSPHRGRRARRACPCSPCKAQTARTACLRATGAPARSRRARRRRRRRPTGCASVRRGRRPARPARRGRPCPCRLRRRQKTAPAGRSLRTEANEEAPAEEVEASRRCVSGARIRRASREHRPHALRKAPVRHAPGRGRNRVGLDERKVRLEDIVELRGARRGRLPSVQGDALKRRTGPGRAAREHGFRDGWVAPASASPCRLRAGRRARAWRGRARPLRASR